MINVKQQGKKLGLTLLTTLALAGVGATAVNAKTSTHHVHHARVTRHVVRKHARKPVRKAAKHKARRAKHAKRTKKSKRRGPYTTKAAKKVQKRMSLGAVAQPASGPHKQKGTKQFDRMFKLGKSKLGTPYLLGAVGTHRFDCGSFTQYLYGKVVHKGMSRNAQVQYDQFKHVSEHNAKPGDLVFFGGSTRSIEHVGMYIGHGKMIDSQLRGVVVEHIHAPWWHAVGYARPANLK